MEVLIDGVRYVPMSEPEAGQTLPIADQMTPARKIRVGAEERAYTAAERQAFEGWASRWWSVAQRSDGSYEDATVHKCWHAWQERAALADLAVGQAALKR